MITTVITVAVAHIAIRLTYTEHSKLSAVAYLFTNLPFLF